MLRRGSNGSVASFAARSSCRTPSARSSGSPFEAFSLKGFGAIQSVFAPRHR